jgi:hypothetical protein
MRKMPGVIGSLQGSTRESFRDYWLPTARLAREAWVKATGTSDFNRPLRYTASGPGLMKSIRHPCGTSFLAKRKSLFERFDQLASRIGAASQVASGNDLSSSAGTLGQDRSGNQFNLNITALNAIGRSMIEVDEGRAGVIQNLD